MDWQNLIDALQDNIKDPEIRKNIYRRMLEVAYLSVPGELDEVLGEDSAFDEVAEEYIEKNEDEEFEEDDDYESENRYDYDDE